MSSIAKQHQKIKSHLITQIDELCDFLGTALEESHSAHETEKALWDWSLQFGHNDVVRLFRTDKYTYCERKPRNKS